MNLWKKFRIWLLEVKVLNLRDDLYYIAWHYGKGPRWRRVHDKIAPIKAKIKRLKGEG